MYCQHRPSQSSSCTVPVDIERHVLGKARFLQQCARIDAGRDAAFHVAGAAAVENAVLDVARMRIAVPERQVADIDGVDMAVQRDDARAAADAAEQVTHRVDA